MPGAVNLNAYFDHKDKHGVKIGDWATQVACEICLPKCTVKFEEGEKELTNHSEWAKHRKASEVGNNNNRQQSVAELFNKDKELDEVRYGTRDLEIAVVQTLSRHNGLGKV